MSNKKNKLNYEEFFKIAILKLRNTSKSRGIHSVFSGFNEAFREYFGEDPIKVTQELVAKGSIEIRPIKKGVMIYLQGEAPKARADLGKTALSKILNEPPEYQKGLIEKVISKVAPDGIRKFPEDFLEVIIEDKKMHSISVPGTPLQLDPNSKTIVISRKRYFLYESRNPPEARYIIYAHEIGKKKIKIPKDNRAVFKAVTKYEKYCKEIKNQSFGLFVNYVNDESIAEILTREVEHKLDLRAKKI